MPKIKYQLKAETLANAPLMEVVNAYHRAQFAEHLLHSTGEVVYCRSSLTAEQLRSFLFSTYTNDQIKEAERLLKAYYKRVARLRVRIKHILTYPNPHFITLTFTSEVLASTSADTRREYVQKFLKSHGTCENYVANIDFGGLNHREHYHAVTSFKPTEWPYGFKCYEQINVDASDTVPKAWSMLEPDELDRLKKQVHEKRLAKYVAKLTNHAIKETTKGSRCIYSRGLTLQPSLSDIDREMFHVGSTVFLEVFDDELPFDCSTQEQLHI